MRWGRCWRRRSSWWSAQSSSPRQNVQLGRTRLRRGCGGPRCGVCDHHPRDRRGDRCRFIEWGAGGSRRHHARCDFRDPWIVAVFPSPPPRRRKPTTPRGGVRLVGIRVAAQTRRGGAGDQLRCPRRLCRRSQRDPFGRPPAGCGHRRHRPHRLPLHHADPLPPAHRPPAGRPRSSQRILGGMSEWLLARTRLIEIVVGLGLGGIFLFKGLSDLL